jgi:2-polyprenyl-3-methyl-5-hydroxy-6-metoxy-1,4-benzoquinol methylase
MSSGLIIKDYGWEQPATCAHRYLLQDIDEMIRQTSIGRDAKILDAGCGGGFILKELYERGHQNIWGFDLSESGIHLARQTYPEIKDRFEIHDAYSVNLPKSFQQGKYDLILSIEVVEHLYSPQEYLRNVSFWLKEGGFLLISTPYHGFLKNLGTIILGKFDSHFNPFWEGGHIKFFSKNTLNDTLKKSGLRQKRFRGSGRMPYFWKSMLILAQKV